MRRTLGILTAIGLSTLVSASCSRFIAEPAVTPVDDQPVAYAADKDSCYVDPFMLELTQAHLARTMSYALDGKTAVRRIPILLGNNQGNLARVLPYPSAPEFEIRVWLPQLAPAAGNVYIEVPDWKPGDPRPMCAFVSLFNDSPYDIPLSEHGQVTTVGAWPWLHDAESVCKYRPKMVMPERRYDFFEFERLATVDAAAMTTVSAITSGPNRPQPFRDETIVYEEPEGD